MKKLEIKHNISKLSLGRTKGYAFGFIKQNDENSFETIMPISTCKDYLNDVVYTEHTKKTLGDVYGFDYKYLNLFKDVNYIGFNIQKADDKLEVHNTPNINRLINDVEDIFNVDVKSKIYDVNDGYHIIEFSSFWSQWGYLISLLTLMIRMGSQYKENPIDYIRSHDLTNANGVKTFNANIDILLTGIFPEMDLYKINKVDKYNIHNGGIMTYKLKK